jgi:two-component system response regulator EvgA
MGSLSSEQEMLQSLSSQEIKVMRYILAGTDNMKIASEMNISNKTVSTYKSRLMEKLNCRSLMDLFSFAQRNKIG